MRSEGGAEPEMEWLVRAFRLAHFIHLDSAIALRVLIEAIDGVEVMAAAQEKRRYYRPIGRRSPGSGRRDRVLLERPHLLQRLIYCESEAFERENEQGEDGKYPSEEDMAVRFIEYLVRITFGRNALYVAVGLGRLLYRLDTSETADLYDLVVQNPERFPASDYLRSRKGILLGEVLQRFEGTIQVRKGLRGEKTIETREGSERFVDLAQAALGMFTPWDTECVVPEQLDPTRDQIPQLIFAGSNPDEEHPIELRRMHALVHPECFAKLVRALGGRDPLEGLALPRFHMALASGNPGGRRRGPPPSLSKKECDVVEKELRRRRGRRRRFYPGRLSVWVDGKEAGCLGGDGAKKIRLEHDRDIERLEVYGQDAEGKLRLAAWMPDFGDTATRHFVSRLAGGAEFRFTLTRFQADSGCVVEAELRPSLLQRALRRVQWTDGGSRVATFRPRYAIALVTLIAVVVGGVLLHEVRRSAESLPQFSTEVSGVAVEAPALHRGPASVAGVALADVETIYVRKLAEDAFSRQLEIALREELVRGGRLRVSQAVESTDAVLEIRLEPDRPGASEGGPGVVLEVVNRSGEILWSRSYRGGAQEIGRRAAMDFAADVERSASQ